MRKLLELIRRQWQRGSDAGDELFVLCEDEHGKPVLCSHNMLRQILREIDGTTRGVPPREIGSTTRAVAQR